MKSCLLSAFVLLLIATSVDCAQAQPSEWQLVHSPSRTTAALALPDGTLVNALCAQGEFSLMVDGLQFREAESQGVLYTDPNGVVRYQTFTRMTDTIGLSAQPISFARLLRNGGTLASASSQGGEPAGQGAAQSLSAASGPLDEALAACGYAPIDERTGQYPVVPFVGDLPERNWAVAPRMTYPDRAYQRGQAGYVGASCIVLPDGRIRECLVERESPKNYSFGQVFKRSYEGGRLQTPVPGLPEAGGIVWFGQSWRLQ